LLVLAATTGGAFAQQYKWVENGKVRYGDVPPPGAQATPLRAPGPGSAAPAPEAKKDAAKTLTPEQAFRKRQEDAQKEREMQAKADQDSLAKRENCSRAQDALRTLESGQRISRTLRRRPPRRARASGSGASSQRRRLARRRLASFGSMSSGR
jgi:hypothetical protein